jgi:hypothetical protein
MKILILIAIVSVFILEYLCRTAPIFDEYAENVDENIDRPDALK